VEDHRVDPQHLRRRPQEEDLVIRVLGRRWYAVAALALINPVPPGTAAGADAAPTRVASFLYLTRESAPEARNSLTEPVVADYGWQGAQFAAQELNANGQFLGVHFELKRQTVAADGDLTAVARAALGSGPALVVADLNASDLLALADLPEAHDSVLIDARTSDDSLRADRCRANVFHVLPSWEMRAAALGHFLTAKGWRHWLLLSGTGADDAAYSGALRKAANKDKASIVREVRLPDAAAWTQAQIDSRIEQMTRIEAPYDMVLITDQSEAFGERVMFNGAESRLVAGTQGLRAVAWDPQFRDFAARGFGYRFLQFASRPMSERDYGNWLAVTILGEVVLRGQTTQPAAARAYLRSERFSVAALKGEPLTFLAGNQQLRQPVLLFGPKTLIAIAPPSAGSSGHTSAGPGEPCQPGMKPET
jgi:ABC transporter substrate binding protein (PQQ-dependent alcohol dehydrogenase system)